MCQFGEISLLGKAFGQEKKEGLRRSKKAGMARISSARTNDVLLRQFRGVSKLQQEDRELFVGKSIPRVGKKKGEQKEGGDQ